MPTQGLMLCRDQRVAAVLRSVFDSEGITLRCLSLAGDGVGLLAKNKYDAVIVDCDDLHDGYDLLCALRNCRSNKSSIAFAITSGKTSVKTAYDAGASFVLEKPITSVGVSKTVRAAHGLILRERHRYFRHPINVSMCVMFYGEDHENEVHLLNVSEGGMAISTDVPRRVEGNVAFRFRLPESKTVIVVKGRVAWSKDQSQFGIEFAPLANLSRKELNTWLARQTYDPPVLAKEVMAAASPARVKSPEIVFLPSLLKASHPQSRDLEVLPLAGFQVATNLRAPSSAAATASIRNTKVARGVRNRNKSLLILFAASVVAIGGWMGTSVLPHYTSEASSPSARKAVDSTGVANPPVSVPAIKPAEEKVLPGTAVVNPPVSVPAIKPAEEKVLPGTAVVNPPVSVPAIKPAEKNVIPDTAVGATQTKAPAAQKTQVVDLLASDTQPRAISGRNATQSESTLEAPSLGTVITGRPSANLVSSISALSTSAPRVTRTSVVEPEVLIHKVAPVYPSIARSAHVDGEVLVRFTIAKDGSVKNAVIEKGHSMLRGAVLDAVQRWKYKPYKVDNEPREIQTLVSVKFH